MSASNRRALTHLHILFGGIVACSTWVLWSFTVNLHRGSSHELPESIPAQSTDVHLPGGATSASMTDCRTCHQFERSMTHPVDIAPSMTIPEHLPLTDGRLTCLTCHEPPESRPDAFSSDMHMSPLRGQSAGTAFCGQCHTTLSNSATDMHALFARSAHHGRDPHESSQVASAGIHHGDFDPRTEQCLACHDDLISSGGIHRTQTRSINRNSTYQGGSSHPMGIPYPSASQALRRDLVPASQLDSRVHLYDGTVGCNTCHSVYSSEKNLLVMSNKASALCLACHAY